MKQVDRESREQSGVVLKLLGPLGVVLELEEYRQIAKYRCLAEWGLEWCNVLVKIAGQSQDAQDAIWDDARTILHFSVIVAGDGFVNQGERAPAATLVLHRLSIQETTDCSWIIDYIIHYHNTDDAAVTDAMLALSQLPHVVKFNQVRIPAMVDVIVSSLALKRPTTLQDAALRAAHSCRKVIALSGDSYMPPHLLSGFSAALHSTLTTSESPRQHLLYLQILYSWAKSQAWSTHILDHGHHSAHLTIANTFPYPDDPLLSEHLALYIIANLQVMQGLSDHPLDLPNATSCRILVQKAWHSLIVRQTASNETVEHLSAFTMDRLHEGIVVRTDDLVSSIRQTFSQLRQGGDHRLTSVVTELLLNITTL
ncbi:uncharacterized protein EDB91DRAFT_719169 [Suillus paluster]|uniref:uncharacterized protein n=1 Tax=Suillus paluster TaxID=48578 RepID=UPI001B85C81F|nr:uncharacterized protein EDB91DRAFT_719169 [Suillus paluster]KAG1731464.1 hypothetical protein EDB91DRAFT_719169 [Suillus paluster]